MKNHELYFNHLGGKGGTPGAALKAQIEKDFGSYDKWLADFKATGVAARGWAFLAWDREYGRLFNMIGDEQFSFPVWNAVPILALDVFEHAFFIDFGAAKAAYIEKFFANLDWSDVEKRFAEAKKERVSEESGIVLDSSFRLPPHPSPFTLKTNREERGWG